MAEARAQENDPSASGSSDQSAAARPEHHQHPSMGGKAPRPEYQQQHHHSSMGGKAPRQQYHRRPSMGGKCLPPPLPASVPPLPLPLPLNMANETIREMLDNRPELTRFYHFEDDEKEEEEEEKGHEGESGEDGPNDDEEEDHSGGNSSSSSSSSNEGKYDDHLVLDNAPQIMENLGEEMKDSMEDIASLVGSMSTLCQIQSAANTSFPENLETAYRAMLAFEEKVKANRGSITDFDKAMQLRLEQERLEQKLAMLRENGPSAGVQMFLRPAYDAYTQMYDLLENIRLFYTICQSLMALSRQCINMYTPLWQKRAEKILVSGTLRMRRLLHTHANALGIDAKSMREKLAHHDEARTLMRSLAESQVRASPPPSPPSSPARKRNKHNKRKRPRESTASPSPAAPSPGPSPSSSPAPPPPPAKRARQK